VPRPVLLVPLVAGALLLIIAEFTTVREVRAVTAVPPGGRSTGGDLHVYALGVLGLAMLPMAFGAVVREARPAAIDVPNINDAGILPRTYESAQAHPDTGFYLESLGAALALVGAVAVLVLTPPRR
jgi:hypothetical protein